MPYTEEFERLVRNPIVEFFGVYYHLHAIYIASLAIVGGGVIFAFEGGEHKYVDTLFMAASAVSETGLASIDTSTMHIGSLIILLLLIAMGSVVLFSVIPPIIRRSYIRAAAKVGHVDIRRSDSIRLELLALDRIIPIVLCYWFVVNAGSIILLGIYCSQQVSVRDFLLSRHVNPWWFAVFHVSPNPRKYFIFRVCVCVLLSILVGHQRFSKCRFYGSYG